MKWKYLICLLLPIHLMAQSAVEPPLAEQFDEVTLDWLEASSMLSSYAGINAYCTSPATRKIVDNLMKTIHAYDSLIMTKLKEDKMARLDWHRREQRKALNDIEKLESEYSLAQFHDHMRESCAFRYEIEKNAEELKNGVGFESYDGKVIVLETEMRRYLKKIDKLMVRIDENIHILDLD